jgi:hypothetical protein
LLSPNATYAVVSVLSDEDGRSALTRVRLD